MAARIYLSFQSLSFQQATLCMKMDVKEWENPYVRKKQGMVKPAAPLESCFGIITFLIKGVSTIQKQE